MKTYRKQPDEALMVHLSCSNIYRYHYSDCGNFADRLDAQVLSSLLDRPTPDKSCCINFIVSQIERFSRLGNCWTLLYDGRPRSQHTSKW